MMTLCLSHIENEKCGFKKYVILILKLNEKIKHHKMNNLIVRCIEIFPIYIFFIFKILTCYDFCHFLQLIFHFTLKSLNFSLNFLTNHMFRDICKVVY
jgi:hypothetical protein